jgi:MoaA/NifB/PqqE/SkfB family radical SAM enzyme
MGRGGFQREYKGKVGKNGDVIFTDEIKKILGLTEGAELRIAVEGDRIELFPNIHSLSKLYIEPTSKCNLMCKTCVRSTWKEPLGEMDIEIFDRLIEQLKGFKELQTVMFGGFGEPSFHKDILYMIKCVKSLGVKAEMVSNGTLLDEDMILGLFESNLDTLWVSFDGTNEDIFDDVREGASYRKVVENLKILKALNNTNNHKIVVGIAFVAMKKNINDLGNVDKLARVIGADRVSVSNVLPYSSGIVNQMLCNWSLSFYDANYLSNSLAISLPMMDFNEYTKEPLYNLLRLNKNVAIMKNQIGTEVSKCKFIKERCTFIRWDGMVCPCMGLLHSNTTYSSMSTHFVKREVTPYTLGNIGSEDLKNIWHSEEYSHFREKVDAFGFSPCYTCASCDLAESNKEDCYGNTFPTCGGCLWAQGVIQCP